MLFLFYSCYHAGQSSSRTLWVIHTLHRRGTSRIPAGSHFTLKRISPTSKYPPSPSGESPHMVDKTVLHPPVVCTSNPMSLGHTGLLITLVPNTACAYGWLDSIKLSWWSSTLDCSTACSSPIHQGTKSREAHGLPRLSSLNKRVKRRRAAIQSVGAPGQVNEQPACACGVGDQSAPPRHILSSPLGNSTVLVTLY